MTPDDMAALHARAFGDARPWSAQEFRALIDHPGTLFRGDARAFALGRVVLDEAELLTIATDPAHRRQGLARACLSDWEGGAMTLGARRAFLEVSADNAAALALYQTAGYARIGCRRAYYPRRDGAAADALVMARSLGGPVAQSARPTRENG